MSPSADHLGSTQATSTGNLDIHLWPDPGPDLNLDLRPGAGKVKDIWVIDNHFKHVFTTVTLGFIGTILCSVGTVGNIINVAVFCRMGFKETINISFLGLAVADIGCLLTQLWLNVMYIPAFRDLADWLLPFDPADPTFRNVTAAWPHICFSRITGLVTAYATLVRCLCIAMPLQVKTMLTPGRSLAVIVSIFLSMFAVVSPVFFASPLGWKYSPSRNRTLYMQLGVDNEVEQITYGLSNVCGYVAFFVVILCTSILITSLRRKARWREGATSAGAAGKDSDDPTGNKPGSGSVSKETKIIKLVVIISAVFIGSYFPSTVVFLAATAMPGFSATGKYNNLFFMACSLTYNMEAINSSVNIFIYLNMSSKYRATFDSMLCRADSSSMVAAKD
ncbi:hypothetical protein RRG08_052910 [Elysia crispata]|uniref:G-protein coupled receptors family 1 profile domain-containing protein n=1 Tax=Elysia crispata TaxID=231223 RepID=A0AAE0ZEA7_9GAST|nr:hypothetical protein RRG08_052910 [Elysia crispata]